MRRVRRNPEKYSPLEVFSEFSRGRGYKLHVQEDFDAFMASFGALLKASQSDKTLVHGKRVEALFGNLAAGLGGCKFIKSEDAGESFAADADIQPPDYKLILNDGTHIFVEVKNCNQRNPQSLCLLHKENIDKIERYSKLHGIPVYYAIYYRCINRWAMLPKSALIEHERKYATNLIHSLANNTMSMLGDLIIGTKPDLVFELVADKKMTYQLTITIMQNSSLVMLKYIVMVVKLMTTTKKIWHFILCVLVSGSAVIRKLF